MDPQSQNSAPHPADAHRPIVVDLEPMLANLGGRLLAIGDVHGCLGALDAMLSAVRPGPADTLVMLGDYVAGGSDSAGVLDRLIELRETTNLVCLQGNHDLLMRSARESPQMLRAWMSMNGLSVLQSYGCALAEDATLEGVPPEHFAFLDGLVDIAHCASHVFVHGALTPGVALARQSVSVCHWQRIDGQEPMADGRVVVCGHASQKNGLPLDRGHAICIDSNIKGGDWLTCLDVRTGACVQTNEFERIRRFALDQADAAL